MNKSKLSINKLAHRLPVFCFYSFFWLLPYGYSLNLLASPPMTESLAPMLQQVLPAIVNIKAQNKITDFSTLLKLQKQQGDWPQPNRNDNHGKEEEPSIESRPHLPDSYVSIASGVIVDERNGYLLTNAHVVSDAKAITVTLKDGRHYTAKLLGADAPSDVALLQIKAKHLTAIELSDSNELKVGDFVAAIGNPFGLSQTVTSGIVSALGRTTLGIESYENFIQTDAPINPGNSGGALVNMKGQLVGINTAILAPNHGNVGIGFAIPANMAKSVMQQLIQYGNVRRGVLGIGVQDISPELAKAFGLEENTQGAAVTQVLENSPAAMTGIQVGDIILHINHSQIKNANDVINTVGFVRIHSTITIELLRQHKMITLQAMISDPKKQQQTAAKRSPFLYGVGLKNINLLTPIHGDIKGVLVISIEEGSNAWRADLRPGDIIRSANQTTVNNLSDLQSIAHNATHQLLLNVLRGSGAIFLVVNQEE